MRKDAQAKGSSHRLAASKAKHDLQVGEAGWKAYKTNMASRYQQLKDRYVHLKNKYRRLRVLIKQEIDLRAEQKQRPDGNTSVHPRHGNPSDQNEMKDEGGLSGSASKSHGSAPVDMPGQKRGNPPILSAKERGIKECPGVAERSPGMPSSDFMKTEGGKKNTNSTGKQQRSKGKLALNDMSNAPRPANGRPCAETPSSISVTCNAGMPNLNCKECEEFYKAAGIRPANLRCKPHAIHSMGFAVLLPCT